ncbi:hypothetical protein BDV33DRAFT_208769 [Aspergillus novoparasiticus]|uniref:Uncharacterized protein n=1 Tax=Aspergillus novoparasiticus TaxID=986946 RepID=A0A5N6ED83_9EURO|nr:hypothetical protein BDV33DRAFT_208769 [Aspergillus novoparasiticus]
MQAERSNSQNARARFEQSVTFQPVFAFDNQLVNLSYCNRRKQERQYKQLSDWERAAQAVENIRKEETTVVESQTEEDDDNENQNKHEQERLQQELDRRAKEAELQRLRKPREEAEKQRRKE